MCGICGIVGKAGNLGAMVTAMHHRGPDDSGTFTDHYVSLGMTRLSILDTSPAGRQPMSTADKKVWLVYNGEFYNFREQRNVLESAGYRFRSDSDTEVLLRMYCCYGDDFLEKIRGMFSLAIYDKREGPGKEKVLLARDGFGIKPLLIADIGSSFLFASEMKSLLASGLISREINTEALAILLVKGSIPQPMTAVAGVHMLLPGYRMILQAGKKTFHRFSQLACHQKEFLSNLDYNELTRYISGKLEESVDAHMVSDVPVGAFLSGGIDSSLLTALMTRLSGQKVKTFSVGFGEEGEDIDESGDAQKIARFIDSHHTRVHITGKDVGENIRHFAGALDQPSVDGLNSYFISRAAAGHVTVAVSGTGGDELFAGYPWFIQMYGETRKNNGRYGDYEDDNQFPLRYWQKYRIFGGNAARDLLLPHIERQVDIGKLFRDSAYRADELANGDPLQRVSALCLGGYTRDQLLRDIDAVSMAHSLEVRVPFLDREIAAAALSLPMETKLKIAGTLPPPGAAYKDTGAKEILFDIGKEILPANIDTQQKRGFTMPLNHWLKTSLKEMLEDTLSVETTRSRQLFTPEGIEKTKEDFYTGKTGWARPWLLMMIELWQREVLYNS
ncbi:MAG: asparagine synthase (glutamine-hydrolyzing) [bacterium]|nr:asparagine synthase (glutamine-hydrolyzing) [bacterium]